METEQAAQLAKAKAFLAPRTFPFDVEDLQTGEKFHFVFVDKGHGEAYDEIGDAKADTPEGKKKLTYRAVSMALAEPKLTPEDLEKGRRTIVDQLVLKYNELFLSPKQRQGRSTAASSSASPAASAHTS